MAVMACSFWFIWIPMLWVYGHYKYIYFTSVVIDFSRQILTTKVDPRDVKVNRQVILFELMNL